MKKLSPAWKLMIVVMAVMEFLSTQVLDYWHDPIGTIVFIHVVPVILTILILVYGPTKE